MTIKSYEILVTLIGDKTQMLFDTDVVIVFVIILSTLKRHAIYQIQVNKD